MFHPGPPVLGGLVQKFVADFDEIVFNPDPPRQGEVHLRGQHDRRLLAEVGKRHSGEQPQVFSSHFISEVAAAADNRTGVLSQPETGLQLTRMEGDPLSGSTIRNKAAGR